MTKTTESAPVEVTQGDREAAADLIEWQRGPYIRSRRLNVPDEIRAGLRDRSGTVQAFARHRAQSEAPLRAEVERLREALEPFAVIGRAIKAAARDSRWLEQVLFYAGTDTDPSSMSLTGRAFDRAAAALESRSHGEAGR